MASGIVIGAGPGIGAAVARRLAREGLRVTVISRSERAIPGALALAADVTDEDALRAALDEAVAAHGVPEVVVYNAGLIRQDRPGELSAQGHLDAWAINVVGAITAAAHLAPRMTAGTILITGGMPEPEPEVTSLSLGKAGVRALTVILAKQYPELHVATVTIPGAVEPGGRYDPDEIAERYWQLHRQPRAEWEREVLYT